MKKFLIPLLLCLLSFTVLGQTSITVGSGKNLTYTSSTSYSTTVVISDGTTLTFPVKSVTKAQVIAAYNAANPVVTPPVPPTGSVVNVGDGKTNFTLDGKKTNYASGTTIVIRAGTYTNGFTIQNLTGVNVIGTGVILTNSLYIGNLNSVKITGLLIQGTPGTPLYIMSRLVNTTLDNFTFSGDGKASKAYASCIQGTYRVTWDQTDNTVQLLNVTISNSTFNDVGSLDFGGNNWQTPTYNFVKGLEIANCSFSNMDNLNVIDSRAIAKFKIHDCTFTNINKTNRDDTRLIMAVGNGDVYNCTFTNICGHSAAINPISWSTTVRDTSHFYNNVTTNTWRYSQYEVQQFSGQLVKGVNQASDVKIWNSKAININLEQYPFNGAFIDNYVGNPQDVTDLSKVYLSNSSGQNWFPIPKQGTFCNMNEAYESKGNVYTY